MFSTGEDNTSENGGNITLDFTTEVEVSTDFTMQTSAISSCTHSVYCIHFYKTGV